MFRDRAEDGMAENLTHNASPEQAQRSFHLSLEFHRVRSDASHRLVHSNAPVHRLQDQTGADIRARAKHAHHHTGKDQRQKHHRAEIARRAIDGSHSRAEESQGGN